MQEKKKLIIWSLFFITIVLGLSAVYIGYRLREQPVISPTASGAQEEVTNCASGGFIDEFSSATLNSAKWQYIQSSATSSRTTISNSTIKMEVDNIDETAQNNSGIQSKELFEGSFHAEVVVVLPLELSQVAGPGSSAALEYVDKDNQVVFGLARKIEYVNNEKVEKITGFVNDRVMPEIQLRPETVDLQLVLEKNGTQVKGILIEKNIGFITVFDEQLTAEINGKLQLNVKSIAPGTQSTTAVFTSFKLSCIGQAVDPGQNTCQCEFGFSTDDQCNFNKEAVCIEDSVCECQNLIIAPTATPNPGHLLATIVISSGRPTSQVTTTSGGGITAIPSATLPPGITATPRITSANNTNQPTSPGNVTTSGVQNAVLITQDNINTCNTTKNEANVKYSIKLTNRTSGIVNLSGDIYLDSKFLPEYIITSTISHGGIFNSALKKITWTGLPAVNVNETLILTFELKLPSTAFGDFSNEVILAEKENNIGSSLKTIKINCLPKTALITDQIDRIIIAVAMIVAGYFMFAAGVHQYAGKLFWMLGGKNVLAGFNKDYQSEYDHEIRKKYTAKMLNKIKEE
ncbi:MAG: hypothetical protein WCJ58_04995 [bacterium]